MFIAPLLAAAAPADQNLSIFQPASPPAESIRQLLVFSLVVVGAIFLLVECVLVYNLLFFRRAPGDDREPAQIYGSMPIEIAWTVAPGLIVFLLLLVIVRTEHEVRATPPEPSPGDRALYVTVVGRQWWWEYIYRTYDGNAVDVVAVNELHVPASTPGTPRNVYLDLQSADVCHSFWVPRLAGKTDLIPGRTNTMWFRTEQTGTFLGQCAEFCGTQHAKMLLRVDVDTPDDFDRWLENQKRPAVDKTDDPKVRRGRDIFLAQTCVNCHRVRGTPAAGTYAPDLTHLMSRATLGSGASPNGREELRRWVVDPQQVKPGCLMPAFHLPDADFDAVVHYLSTLK